MSQHPFFSTALGELAETKRRFAIAIEATQLHVKASRAQIAESRALMTRIDAELARQSEFTQPAGRIDQTP